MVETIKLTFTYIIALVVVLGGGYMLYATRGEAGADNLQLVVSGFIGAALAFVFGGEIQTRTARQQERALLTGPATSTTTYVNGTGAVTPPTDTETA
jgi:hypothetical protein